MNLKSIVYLLFFVCSILGCPSVFAQSPHPITRHGNKVISKKGADTIKPWEVDTLIQPVPLNRQLFVDRVHKAINQLDMEDGILNQRIDLGNPSKANNRLNHLVFHTIPLIDIHIENLKVGNQIKIGYHRYLEDLIRRYTNVAFTDSSIVDFERSAKNFEGIIIAIQKGTVEEFVHHNANIYTINNGNLLNHFPKEKAYAFRTFGMHHPDIMIKRLPEFANEKYADPIVAAAARVVPGVILNYATSTSHLSDVVRRNQNPLVKTIVKIADNSRDPLKALPFLGQIYNKEKTIHQIDEETANPKSYFKALAAAEIENDSIGRRPLATELNYRGLQLVRVVNSLHESPDHIRFASIMDYNAAQLYFMIIGSQDEIYTSSFVFMANRLINDLKTDSISGTNFLKSLHYYHFRTWVRMCAGYNELSPFFSTMSEQEKRTLMEEFVGNLEKGGPNDLEDAVDVADAFGSITDPKLMDFLQKQVIKNYKRCKYSKKGTIVYGLLSTIMENTKNSQKLTHRLSIIPPITYVPHSELINKDSTVIIKAYFYGDPDGHMSFNSFQTDFPSSEWIKKENAYWVEYIYKGKHKIHVYANLPGDETKNTDAIAQKALENYLVSHHLQPTIVIHRGHSYHLSNSLKYLDPKVKVVMVGSCGGYHNLKRILDKSPDANIISTKQTGSMRVNEPIIRELLKQLTAGDNIDWIKSWEELDKYFSKKGAHDEDLFSDYVPPNKNLGAIFVKAYRKMLQETNTL